MSKTVKLGFVGAGYMGQMAHMVNYEILPNVVLTALAEGRTRTAAAVAHRFGIRNVYASHGDMLAAGGLDAVVVATRFAWHHDIVPDALEADMHCLTEKPICVRAETAHRLSAMASERQLVYHVGYMKRCDPAARSMRSLLAGWLASGESGAMRLLRVSMPPGDWIMGMTGHIDLGEAVPAYAQEWETPPEWMSEDIGRKYVSFVNYYIHQVNLIRYLLGDFTVSFAEPTGAVLVAQSDGGVPIVLEMNSHSQPHEWTETYTAFFERGWLRLDLPAPLARQRAGTLEIYRNGEGGARYERPVFPPLWSMAEQARLFLDSVRNGAECISPAGEAAKDLETAEAYMRLLAAC